MLRAIAGSNGAIGGVVVVGVDFLWDANCALAIAVATGASFMREVVTGFWESDMGPWAPDAAKLLRDRRYFGREDLAIFANITTEFASAVGSRSAAMMAKSTVVSSLADEILSVIAGRVKTECEKALLKIPRISIEPGRVIVGPAMVTIYKVGTTKEVTLSDGSTRWYVSVDGGMSDNIRPALYEAQYSITLANRSSSAPLRKSRVVGKHCETGDIIIRDVQLPSDISPGDLLVVPATGAYGRSMASNYNHMTRPPVICVLNGKARSIIRRETHRDLLALEIEEEPRQIGKGGAK